jgi:hypothetical protein
MFTLTITTDNAAFEEDARGEVARILRALATRIDDGSETLGGLYDGNGNRVGRFVFEADAAGDGDTGRG